jgi:SCP-2 sterol transfer family
MQFFFMHLGTLVGVITYFVLCERGAYSAEAVRFALPVALAVHTAYMAIANLRGELKHLDYGVWLMFAIGTLAALLGGDPLVTLFQHYSPAILFTALGLTGLIPLLLRRETFTYYYGRRQSPQWQQKLPEFHKINRLMTAFWVLIFFTGAALCAWSPRDPIFTFVLPNALVLLLGIPARHWLPALYLRFFPPEPPTTAEALIMGMPFAFDRRAARDVAACIQFRVTGNEPGDYHVRILRGKCESFEGVAPKPDVTVHTPDNVWVQVSRGEVDGERALMEGRYRAEGDLVMLAQMGQWFGRR